MIDVANLINGLLDEVVLQVITPLTKRIAVLEEQIQEVGSADYANDVFRDAVKAVIDDYDFEDVIDQTITKHESEHDHEAFVNRDAVEYTVANMNLRVIVDN